jgi:putative Mg2+ transporter-C (MgtC) family protein
MNETWSVAAIWPIGLKIGLSALLGALVGAEREWTGKAAGLRTHMLIAIGAALLTDISVHIGPHFSPSGPGDPARIAAQVVSGIGFIGAGTILQARGAVHGLTTAAGLWVAAAIGMAVGATFYVEAILGTAALLIILALLRPLEHVINRGHHRIALTLDESRSVDSIFRVLEEAGVTPRRLRIRGVAGRRRAELQFRGPATTKRKLLQLASDAGIDVEEWDE